MVLLISSMIFETNVFGSNKKNTKILGKVVTNNNVDYSFENGELTVSGTGVMDNSFAEKYNKNDIKSVIIKEGITGISDDCFDECDNIANIKIPKSVTKIGHFALGCNDIKEIVIPSTVKEIGEKGLGFNYYKKVTMPATIKVNYLKYEEEDRPALYDGADELYLNTQYNPKIKNVLYAKNIYTYSRDKKYRSKNGVVYTKNGKTLVQVPALRKNVVIRKGCTTVLTSALGYYQLTSDCEIFTYLNPSSITIPGTVKKVKYDLNRLDVTFKKRVKWKLKTKKLSGKSIENLCLLMNKKNKVEFFKLKNAKIKVKKKMAVTKDGVLVSYLGNAKSVKIPKNVKRIGKMAFYRKHLRKVVFNKKLKYIGASAFELCIDLKTVKWNKKLRKIGEYAFACTYVKKKTIPKKTKVEKNAFWRT